MSIVLISGSPSEQSRSARLLSYVAHLLSEAGQNVQTIQIRLLDSRSLILADWNHPDIQWASRTIAKADAVIVATPVYKAAYSGILKAFLDVLPQDGLAGKAVGSIATGGSPAHTLVLDYALRPVLSSLGTRHYLGGVFGTDRQIEIRDNGDFRLESSLQERLNELALNTLEHVSPGQKLGPSATSEIESYLSASELTSHITGGTDLVRHQTNINVNKSVNHSATHNATQSAIHGATTGAPV
jgi:FMN reductase